MFRHAPAALLLASALAAAPAVAQDRPARDEFAWTESMPAGARLRVHSFNGPVEVRAGAGSRAEVRGRPDAARGDVRFEVVRDGADVTICALPLDGAECTRDGVRQARGDWGRHERTVARFEVVVPRGVRVDAATGNGAVTVEGADAAVTASTGNGTVRVRNVAGTVRASSGNGTVRVVDAGGPVDVSTGNGPIEISTASGPVSASSGNGSIDVRMRSLGAERDMRLSTGNGSITVGLPADFAGEVSSNGHRHFDTDFPIVLRSGDYGSRLRGTIGRGGPRLELSTGSGAVTLRRLP